MIARLGPWLAGLLVGFALSTPAAALEIIGTGDTPLELQLNKGRLVRLEQPVSSIFVADAEVADVQAKSPRLVYVFGKKVGETTLFAVDQNENVVVSERVVVRHNLSGLRDALRAVAPDEQVRVDSIDSSLVLRGAVDSAETAENVRRVAARFAGEDDELINYMKVKGPNQINLRVRIAEVSRDLLKSFGVNWDLAAAGGDFLFGFARSAAAPPLGSFISQFNVDSDDVDLNVLIDALAQEGLVTVLAEPNLTAMSGETAEFLAGGEFPIPVAQDEDSITIEFKEFGVALDFTPTLLKGSRISLKVAPEVSELDFNNAITLERATIPALTTRRASTTVELGSGQSFAIAGLLKNTTTHTIDRMPGLGDLPILGALFRSDSFQKGETELVIIVTPYTVRPVSERRLAQPTDGLIPPNDAERILFGRQYGRMTAARLETDKRLAGQQLSGPVGFMME